MTYLGKGSDVILDPHHIKYMDQEVGNSLDQIQHTFPNVLVFLRYDPYQKRDEERSPFKPDSVRRHINRFQWKLYDGGL